MLKVPEDKVSVHLLGVNEAFRVMDEDVVEATLAPYDLPSEYMLFVGTIEPRKNIPNLLRAYAQLRASDRDMLPLVLGGQRGWFAEESLQTIEDLGLENCVYWFEDVPFDVLPALYNRARLVVLVSFHEGFGMPAIEAMACGTPVVVSKRGSLPEVVGEHGVYVEAEDIDSIADGIGRLLGDRVLYERLRDGGLGHAKTYSWQRTAEIALGVYHQLLAM
jgi:glycosyltransferase involved in cell wall biosynthesis